MHPTGASRHPIPAERHDAPRGRGVARAGLTLVELLMVMALLALVFGFGVGAISSIDVGGRSAVSLVQTGLRSARNWAIARDAPARVRIDPAAGTLAAEGLAVVGTWHFEEDPPRGAFRLNGTLSGAEITNDGFLGGALSFVGAETEAGYEVAVHEDPAFDLTHGFVIQCALRPEGMSGGRVLALGEAVTVSLEQRNELRIEFAALRVNETGRHVAAGKAVLSTEPGVVPPDRWSRLTVSYDRRRLRAFVEGVPVGELEEDAMVAPIEASMVVGGGRRVWQGAVDSLVISAVAVSDTVELPDGVRFGPDTPEEVVFWPGGGLDRTVHSEPAQVVIDFDDGERVAIRVGLYGNVE